MVDDRRHVGRLHEAVAGADPMEARGQELAAETVGVVHLGLVRGHDREDDDVLVEGLVVREVVQEHRRHAFRRRAQEDGGAGHAGRRHAREPLEERLEGHRRPREQHAHQLGATLPGREKDVDRRRDDEGDPAARADLREVGAQECEVEREEERGEAAAATPASATGVVPPGRRARS